MSPKARPLAGVAQRALGCCPEHFLTFTAAIPLLPHLAMVGTHVRSLWGEPSSWLAALPAVSLSCELRPCLAGLGPWPALDRGLVAGLGNSDLLTVRSPLRPEHSCCSHRTVLSGDRASIPSSSLSEHLQEKQLLPSLTPLPGSCFFQMPVAGARPGPRTDKLPGSDRVYRVVWAVRAVQAVQAGPGDRPSLQTGQTEGSVFSGSRQLTGRCSEPTPDIRFG